MKPLAHLKNIVLAMLLLSMLSGAKPLAAQSSGSRETWQPKPLGELDLRSQKGESVSLIPFITRKAIVMVFWAAWCPICQAEVPRINGLNANPNVKVLAANEGDSTERIETFIAANRVGYQVVVDPTAELAKAFGVPGMPYAVIINRSGVVAYRGYKLPEDMDYYIK